MEGWTWKALCNEAPFRFGKNLASSGIRTRTPWSKVGSANRLATRTLHIIMGKKEFRRGIWWSRFFLTSVFIYLQLLKASRRWNRDPANTRVDSAQKHLHQTGMWLNTRESILERSLTTVNIVGEALPRKEIWKLTNLHTCINSSTKLLEGMVYSTLSLRWKVFISV